MLLQGKHLIPYTVNTVQRLFRLQCSQYSGKLLIANQSQYRRSAKQPPNLGKQYIFQMLCRDTMHRTLSIGSALIFLADIVNIFSAIFLDCFGSEHRSITVAAIDQTCKWFYGIARLLWRTAFICLECHLCLLPRFRRNYSLVFGIIDFTLIAEFSYINGINKHIAQNRKFYRWNFLRWAKVYHLPWWCQIKNHLIKMCRNSYPICSDRNSLFHWQYRSRHNIYCLFFDCNLSDLFFKSFPDSTIEGWFLWTHVAHEKNCRPSFAQKRPCQRRERGVCDCNPIGGSQPLLSFLLEFPDLYGICLSVGLLWLVPLLQLIYK